MPPSHVDWTPGVVILVVGLVVGAALIWRLLATRSRIDPKVDSLELRDLDGKRDSLIQQLKELDETAGSMGAEERSAERRRLELEAARTLRSIDQLRAGPSSGKKKRRPDSSPTTHNPQPTTVRPEPYDAQPATVQAAGSSATKGFFWGVGLMVAVGLLIFFVSREATERVGDAQLTGNLPEAVQQQPDQELRELLAKVEQNPEDINARLELSYAFLVRENLMEVFNQTEQVLKRVPGEPRALSYQALVRLAMGQGDMAESMLKQALATEPDLLDARIHLALVYTELGRADEATEVMKEAMERHPDQRELLTNLLAEIRASMTDPERAAQRQQAGAPPGTAPPASAGPGGTVSGTLELASANASIQPGALLFITVRAAGVTAGPPVAAKRLPVTSFPIAFSVSAADSMMGQDLPERLRIEARIDSDGNALTRGENEPVATLDDVTLGTASLRLVLR